MLELKDAYEILGIKEGAGKDGIIKRYNLLLKKYKMSAAGENDEVVTEVNIEDINRAYNLLMGYGNKEQEQEAADTKNTALGSILKKAGIDEKKARNFFYYYKFHMLAIIVGILIVGSIVSSIVNKVDPDLNVVIAGEFQVNQSDTLKQDIKNKLSGSIKEVSVDPLYLSPDPKSEMDIGMKTKFVTLMAAGDLDVLILDRTNFEDMGKKGAFLSLDDIAGQLGIDKNANKRNILKDEESGKEHLFGIDVSKSEVLKGIDAKNKEKIAAIRSNCKHYDNALSFVKLLVK